MKKVSNTVLADIPMFPDDRHRLSTKEEIRNYLEGGCGVVTLHSPTGVYRTYSFRKPHDAIFADDDFYRHTLFVYAKTSSGTWMYVGMYNRNCFRLTEASRYGTNHPIVKGARYLVRMMNSDVAASGPMILYHEGVCSVCGRRLTSPKSIMLGVGPTCRKRG